jgi:hypothetical protein
VQLFQKEYGNAIEGLSYPTLFPFGKGYFDDELTIQKKPTRFREYRRFLMHQHSGRFASHPIWAGWSAQCEKFLRSELVKQLATERYQQQQQQQ